MKMAAKPVLIEALQDGSVSPKARLERSLQLQFAQKYRMSVKALTRIGEQLGLDLQEQPSIPLSVPCSTDLILRRKKSTTKRSGKVRSWTKETAAVRMVR